ncbi:hypothetical protein K493DRAFT_315316 [Basidiobolus meristosporus CBS 931.73]|uniref:Uncharacterized protein n=1 Tax=Basidiobolus meristosporus CBS 931.73 TaxID=1314790 RepID=A0A1Y1YA66_9FUNG|nr:hypothetical protein K493DRAFT_315316 [Basidiobolus meristosporus CBS 931.73]|eukprot:ORX94843.1 hypothetical protein K493DRAFT_315316 [Basidiobolus meristosporus CBS 931.73]
MLALLLAPFTLPIFKTTFSLLEAVHRTWLACALSLAHPLHFLLQCLWQSASDPLKDAYRIWARKGFEALLPLATYPDQELDRITPMPRRVTPPRRSTFRRDTSQLRVQLVRNMEAKWRRKTLSQWAKEASLLLAHPPMDRNIPRRSAAPPTRLAKREGLRAMKETKRELQCPPLTLPPRLHPPWMYMRSPAPSTPRHSFSTTLRSGSSLTKYPLRPPNAPPTFPTLVYLTPS